MYQIPTNQRVNVGSYGRVGVDWNFENGGSIGRRLNLNNMGSIGGRLEEQDYLEVVPNLNWIPKDGDSTRIYAQLRLSMYSTSATSFGNSTSNSLGGLEFAMPEMYVEARNIRGSGVSMWVGARLYRGEDVHIADHFYFNDHSGQGFGVEFKKNAPCGSVYCFYRYDSHSSSLLLPEYQNRDAKYGTEAKSRSDGRAGFRN